ncbi:hypothetical protein F5Y16DRAFT_421909 [Xylariaceae sp. FL0255]|nr:hypothetical protein F5Y16DRAFT_421909 [Xylariaceae sp. FL0255]
MRQSKGRVIHSGPIRRKYNIVQEEVNNLKEVFELIKKKPYPEALEIFSRLRLTTNSVQVLQLTQDATLLLPPQPNTSSSGPKIRGKSMLKHWSRVRSRFRRGSGPSSSTTDWYRSSYPASSPTTMAILHRWYIGIYSLPTSKHRIRRAQKTVHPRYSTASVLSNAAVKMGNFRDPSRTIANVFLGESKRLLVLERGRESIPTVVSLCLMHLTSAHLGEDRIGAMYRYMASATAKRLCLEQKFVRLEEDDIKHLMLMNMAPLPPVPELARTLFVLLSVMAAYLDDAECQQPFTRVGFMMLVCAPLTSVVRFMLLGVWSLAKATPEAARPCYEGLGEWGRCQVAWRMFP